MPNDFADKDVYVDRPPMDVPQVTPVSLNPSSWLEPIEGEPMVYKVHDAGPSDGIVFRPFYDLHHQYYSVYWNCPMARSEI